ncbi:uncharacterized protein LOC143838968 [Paroedura picta]|uniref:uncharacterized protein LOC143838968 n=1 Tax=Paroedura picta TaxID=143630 RepID=UPI004055F4B5
MKTPLSTCLFWALFSTGASLLCYSCFSETGSCGDSTIQQCSPGEDACLSQSGVSTLPFLSTAYFKYCLPLETCTPGFYSGTTSQNIRGQVIETCCNTDLCNSDTPQIVVPRTEHSSPDQAINWLITVQDTILNLGPQQMCWLSFFQGGTRCLRTKAWLPMVMSVQPAFPWGRIPASQRHQSPASVRRLSVSISLAPLVHVLQLSLIQ